MQERKPRLFSREDLGEVLEHFGEAMSVRC